MGREDNKAIVRRFYDEVMGQGRVEVLDDIMVEDFVDHGEALFGSPRVGRLCGKASPALTKSSPVCMWSCTR